MTKTEEAAVRRAQRAGIFTEAVKAALLINGGAAVAVMAFMQAVWVQCPGLVPWAIASLMLFASGVLAATVVNVARYYVDLYCQRTEEATQTHEKGVSARAQGEWGRCQQWAMTATLAAFVLGAFVLAFGALLNMPDTNALGPPSSHLTQPPTP